MRSKVWGLLLCIYCLWFVAPAQTPSKHPLVLKVSNGGFISFKSETSATDGKPVAASQSLASLLYSQALTGENRIIHRVLTDANGQVIFGYDVWVNPDPITRKFSLAVMPADEAFRRTFLKESAQQRSNDTFATFPTSTRPQTLDDGDAVSLELLVNRESGLKIVDVVKVAFDRSKLRDNTLEPPKDFTLDAIALSVKKYELLINSELAGKSNSNFGCTGSLLWLYVPNRGRFIFSLVPREGYAFEKIGILDDNRIEFSVGGEFYEWISSDPVLPSGGTWSLWVLSDPGYFPLFGPEKKKPRSEPGVLDKINKALVLNPGGSELTFGVTGAAKQSNKPKNKIDVPERVMVGGADSMEHLLPKSP